ncbi:diguanylate cyclase [Rhizobium brockwellii]|uniref:GGDEF domain-containing protein n=1 Tax=Rhizobium brockwellii TaxID=3019932 RepID=UPI003F97685A
MTGLSLQKKGFANAVINALSSNICVLDRNARIIAVNLAWQSFGSENSHRRASDVGSNYLHVCENSSGAGSAEADEFGAGVRAVLDGSTRLFQMEYPCHSPASSRWFLGRVTPLGIVEGGAVISHENITGRRLLENELEKLAATDPLTGLPNRRYFFDMANAEFEKVRRFDAKASIIMMDVDAFKAVNDTHGHAAGDEVLRTIGRRCRETMRQSDVLARFGGEEFVVLLPHTTAADATKLAELLRMRICEQAVQIVSRQIFVTASFGVTEVHRDDLSLDDALVRADKALYQAKHAGRNCVR